MRRADVEYTRNDERGSLIQVNTDNWKQLNYLILKEGKSFGKHYHVHKKELFYVTKGKVAFDVGGDVIIMERTDGSVLIEPFDMHTITALEDSEIVEILSEPYDGKDVWTK